MLRPIIIAFDLDDRYSCYTGILIDDDNAIFIESSSVNLAGVKAADTPGVYYSVGGYIELGTMRQPLSIHQLIEKLQDTNMYDYLLRRFDRTQEVDFDLL